jgi:hypothetical protein
MPKKRRKSRKKACAPSKRARAHDDTRHERLRALKRNRLESEGSTKAPRKRKARPRVKATSASRARLEQRVTAQTLRDLMALNCVRRCTH